MILQHLVPLPPGGELLTVHWCIRKALTRDSDIKLRRHYHSVVKSQRAGSPWTRHYPGLWQLSDFLFLSQATHIRYSFPACLPLKRLCLNPAYRAVTLLCQALCLIIAGHKAPYSRIICICNMESFLNSFQDKGH